MIFDGISKFLNRENNLKSIRLSGNSPCIDCENIHRYNSGTALMAEEVEPEKCEMCTKKLNYDTDCRMKLAYYERNDPRVKDLEQKSAHIYDRGVICPETLCDGCPVTYPTGWADVSEKRWGRGRLWGSTAGESSLLCGINDGITSRDREKKGRGSDDN